MKTTSTRIILFSLLLIFCLTACSDYETYEISIQSDGLSKPGFVAESDGYTFITDYDNVYKINNETAEKTVIFSSDEDDSVNNILLYSGYIFIQDNDHTVFVTDYNGEILDVLIYTNIIFIADGYIYYENDTEIRRVKGMSYDTELIAGKNEWGDHAASTDYIGYYDKKIYFERDEKIHTLTKDGEKQYYCDGELISLNENKLIFLKEGAFYSKDLLTGHNKRIGNAPNSEYSGAYAKYIGNYADKEYYIVAGKIVSEDAPISVINGTTYDSVYDAVMADACLYADNGTLSRYSIETQEKDFISFLGRSNAIAQCGHHIYYIIDDEDNADLFQFNLDDYSIRQIISGPTDIFDPEDPLFNN